MHTLKKVTAAVIVAVSAGSTEAAIVDGITQPSELFVNVWDETAQQSYALDLGITTAQFLANPTQTLSFNLAGDANYTSFLTPQSPLMFNVAGFSLVLNDLPDIPGYGALITSNGDVAGSTSGWSQAQVDNAGNKISVHIGGLNAVESNATANGAGNGSGIAGPTSGDAYFGANTWLTNLGGGLPFNNTAGVDTPLGFWQLGTSDGSDAVATPFDGSWTLSSNGTLTYSAVSAVPVPAAVWLFGSGLVGMIGVARRKLATAVPA
jgi:hypothetical protein